MNRLVVGDYIVIGVYVIGVLLLGILFAGRQKSMKKYFLASGNLPWWAVSLSMYAAFLSFNGGLHIQPIGVDLRVDSVVTMENFGADLTYFDAL